MAVSVIRHIYGTSHSKLHDVRRSTGSCQMTVRVLIVDRTGVDR